MPEIMEPLCGDVKKSIIKAVNHKYYAENPPLLISIDGKVMPNSILADTQLYHLVFDEISGAAVGEENAIAVTASNRFHRTMTNSPSGVCEVNCFSSNDDTTAGTFGDYLVDISQDKVGRSYMNRPIHARTIIGPAGKPFELPIPIVLNKSQFLKCTINTLSFAGTISFGFQCNRSSYNIKQQYKEFGNAYNSMRPYMYTTEEDVVLGDSEEKPFIFKIVDDAYFFWSRLTCFSDEDFDIQIMKFQNSEPLSNGRIHKGNIGFAANYYDFRVPMVLEPNIDVKMIIRNLSSNSNRVFLTFTGVHYYHELGI